METQIEPYIDGMTYDEGCFLAIDVKLRDGVYDDIKVMFYNPSQDDNQYLHLKILYLAPI